MRIRQATSADSVLIAEIYNHYVKNSHSTFEIEPIDSTEMRRRMMDGRAAGYPFLVIEDDLEVVGYAYGRRFRPRFAYLYSIEVSVYVKNGKEGRNIGSLLYDRLLKDIRQMDFHAVIGGISLPNEASVRLHEKFGFQKVAHFRQVGRKFDRWIDVGYWELLLDHEIGTIRDP